MEGSQKEDEAREARTVQAMSSRAAGIAAATFCALAACVLMAACGKSNPASTDRADAAVENMHALAYASAINLQPSNVPGLVASPLRKLHELKSGPFGTIVDHCDGGNTGSGPIVGIMSQRFMRDNEQRHGAGVSLSLLPIERVHSAVYVMESASQASREFAATDSARARACLERLSASEHATIRNEGSKTTEPIFTHIEVSALPSPLKGVQTYGWRMTAENAIGAREGRSLYYEDFFGFVRGSTLVTLNATGDPHPFSSATERRLLALLYLKAVNASKFFAAGVYHVPSGSMEPTLDPGARVTITPGTPKVGDIVVLYPPEGAVMQECGPVPHNVKPGRAACAEPVPRRSNVKFIKRIVAAPGDEIYIKEGHVYRRAAGASQFVREQDPYIRACGATAECNFPTPITIPAGQWFMMGDNRGESDDSRFWGPVLASWIVGIVTACATPPAHPRTLGEQMSIRACHLPK